MKMAIGGGDMMPRKNLMAEVLLVVLYAILAVSGCKSDPSTTYGSSKQTHTETSVSAPVTAPVSSTVPATTRKPDATTAQSSSTATPAPSATQGPSPTVSLRPTPTLSPGSTSKPATVTPTPAEPTQPADRLGFRQEMRDFIKRISATAKSSDSSFVVIQQNGEDLVMEAGRLQQDYLSAVDGIGREDFLYGYQQDNLATPAEDRNYILSFLNRFKSNHKTVMITDYCSSENKVLDSYQTNSQYGFISFAADQRDLNSIPPFPQPVFNENDLDISTLSGARNFLYIINPDRYSSKNAYIDAIAITNYDLVIVDLFFHESALTRSDVASLQVKHNGAKRMVICYMSIGEAEDYRYYWDKSWTGNPPHWLLQENPDWPGNYKVNYWDPDWQQIIVGPESAYLSLILKAGFDGVYMDLVDAYEYFTE